MFPLEGFDVGATTQQRLQILKADVIRSLEVELLLRVQATVQLLEFADVVVTLLERFTMEDARLQKQLNCVTVAEAYHAGSRPGKPARLFAQTNAQYLGRLRVPEC